MSGEGGFIYKGVTSGKDKYTMFLVQDRETGVNKGKGNDGIQRRNSGRVSGRSDDREGSVYTRRGNVLVSLRARSFRTTSAGFNNSFKLAHQWRRPAILVRFKGVARCVTMASSEAITCEVLRPQRELALHYVAKQEGPSLRSD